jgi:hypothetical protein
LSWWRREVGASASAAVPKILLLDFKTLHPSVLAVREQIDAECPATMSARRTAISDAGVVTTKADDSEQQ